MSNEFTGGIDYKSNTNTEPKAYYKYKIWNNNVKNPTPTPTPGVVMIKSVKGADGQYTKTQEIAQSVNAVLLYSSMARNLSTGMGKNFRSLCSSDDGITPSLKVSKPLCSSLTAEALAETLSQWKGFDKAKVDAKLEELTQGGKLKVCGLKTATGSITLCPYGRKNPVTGKKGDCEPLQKLFLYDLDRKRTFTMDLSGSSIRFFEDKVADYHLFMQHVSRMQASCFNFSFTLAPKDEKGYYSTGFSNYIQLDEAVSEKMKELAFKARDRYILFSTPKGDTKPEQQLVTIKPAKVKEENKKEVKQEPVVEDNIDDVDF